MAKLTFGPGDDLRRRRQIRDRCIVSKDSQDRGILGTPSRVLAVGGLCVEPLRVVRQEVDRFRL